jgi:hypothetical protein
MNTCIRICTYTGKWVDELCVTFPWKSDVTDPTDGAKKFETTRLKYRYECILYALMCMYICILYVVIKGEFETTRLKRR